MTDRRRGTAPSDDLAVSMVGVSSGANSSNNGGGAGTSGIGLLRLRAKAVRKQIHATNRFKHFKNPKDSGFLSQPKSNRRKGSIDTGPEDWPNEQDMSQWAPPIHQKVNYQELIEEISALEVTIACEKLPKELLPPLPEQQPQHSLLTMANPAPDSLAATATSPNRQRKVSMNKAIDLNTMSPGRMRPQRGGNSESSGVGLGGGGDTNSPKAKLALAQSQKYNYHTTKVRIPTHEELGDLPEELAKHVQEAGRQTLVRLFVPLLCMRQRVLFRRKLLAQRQADAPSVPVDFLANHCPLFKAWPAEFLPKVVAALTYRCYENRELVVYEREPASAMLFLVAGTVQEIKRSTMPREVSKQISSIRCFGEMHLLTDEPWLSDVKVSGTRAEFWVLTKPKFQNLLRQVPQHVMSYIIRTAFERRNSTMRKKFPLTPEMLRGNTLFSECSVDFVRDLLERLEPHAVPKDYTICEEGEPCESIFFVVHGSIGQFKLRMGCSMRGGDDPLESTTSSLMAGGGGVGNKDGSGTGAGGAAAFHNRHDQILTVGTGSIIAASPMAHGAAYDGTFKTLTDVDLYVLNKNQFHSLTRNYPSDLDYMLEAARSQRHDDIATNMSKYVEVVQSIPLLGLVLKRYHIKDFLPLLQPKSYRPLSSVCSTSSFCDRIIIVTKGKLRLGNGRELSEGDCVGWTSCVPHRWGQGVITMNATAEALEVPCQDLMDFLDSKNLLNKMVQKTKMLLFPNAFLKVEVDALHAQLGPHPPFYPISPSRTVNHNEQGFCTVHMHLLEEHQRQECERKRQIDALTPPPYRQLSSGVWVPKSRQVRGFTTKKS